MNLNQSFIRKIIYVAGIAVLLFPLFRLGQPATLKSSGGKLAELREEYNLSQSRLGEIDPVSEAVKLATLGMRGVAVVVMWDKATEFKRKEDFDNFRMTLEQLTKLAPNFLTFWEFQAHNISYNTSVEYDAYLDRYRWVKNGIEFMIQGTRYNRKQARLLHQVAWFLAHKLGRSDERIQFRQLFREDTDFHKVLQEHGVDLDEALGAGGLPDNWLVARQWFQRAEEALDKDAPVGGRLTPLLLYSQRPRSLINYARSLEEEGKFDDETQAAYSRALADWKDFGTREIFTPFGHNLVLDDLDRLRPEVAKYRKRIIAFDKTLPEKIRAEKMAKLSEEEREALNTPAAVRTEQQNAMAEGAEMMLEVTPQELADRVPEANKEEARQLAEQATVKGTLLMRIESARSQVNYEYWRVRCEVEQTENAIKARRIVKEASRLMRAAQLQKAKARYEEGWIVWDEIFKEYPALERDDMADELMSSFRDYFSVLQQLELKAPPEDFLLTRLFQYHDLDPNRIPEPDEQGDGPGPPGPGGPR